MKRLAFTIFGFFVAGLFGLLAAASYGMPDLPSLFGFATAYALLGAMLGFVIDAIRWPRNRKEP